MSRSSPCPAPGEVRVSYVQATDVLRDPSWVSRATSWLTPAERARHARFVHDEDRAMFLAGRLLARTLVGRALGCPPGDWPWREGPHGRPEIDRPDATLRFNVAHSAGLVACALASDRDVGVDVEDRLRPPVDPGFVRRYCSPAEARDVEAQPRETRNDRFLTYWTLKEAYLKARGLGISVTLSDITFNLDGDEAHVTFAGSLGSADTRWRFHLARPTSRHLVAVAADVADGRAPVVHVDAWHG